MVYAELPEDDEGASVAESLGQVKDARAQQIAFGIGRDVDGDIDIDREM